MRLKFKIWIDSDGKTFGPGPARLLRGIEKTGSLRQAAAELGMSYNKAWWNIRTMEDRLGFALLHRSIGGTTGGGSTLTPHAADLLARFDALEQEAAATLDAAFENHLGDFAAWERAPLGGAANGEAGSRAMPLPPDGTNTERSSVLPTRSRGR